MERLIVIWDRSRSREISATLIEIYRLVGLFLFGRERRQI